MLRKARVYFPYFGLRVRFEDEHARRWLEPLDVRIDPLDRVLRHADGLRPARALGPVAADAAGVGERGIGGVGS